MSELVRANRVSVQMVDGDILGRFWKTHKLVAEIPMAQAIGKGYVIDTTVNMTAQRELYRAWICKYAELFGVRYDVTDNRADANRYPSKYTDDAMLTNWAIKIVEDDMRGWASKMGTEYKQDIIQSDAVADGIEPMTTRNGKDVDSKYSNGNWAYARIPVCITYDTNGQQGYVTVVVELVSGQLKKPSNIGDLGYTYTGFKTELLKDIQGYLPKVSPSTTDTKTDKGADKKTTSKKKDSKKKTSTSKKKTPKDTVVTDAELSKIEDIIEGK